MFKGVLWHTIGKILFLLSSYAIHFFLGKALSPAEYGVVGTIITILDFDYLFLNNGVRQSISKALAGGAYDKRDVVKKGIFFQLLMVALVFGINFFGAPAIASLLGDESLAGYIRYAAFIIPFTGIYFAGLGVFNGMQAFSLEAGIISVYPILKLAVIPLVAFVFTDPVVGTEAGFFFAAAAICGVTVWFLIRRRACYQPGGKKINFWKYAKNALSYSLLFSIVSVIMNMDTLIVKAVTSSDTLVGYYTGAVTFSKVPYLSFGGVLSGRSACDCTALWKKTTGAGAKNHWGAFKRYLGAGAAHCGGSLRILRRGAFQLLYPAICAGGRCTFVSGSGNILPGYDAGVLHDHLGCGKGAVYKLAGSDPFGGACGAFAFADGKTLHHGRGACEFYLHTGGNGGFRMVCHKAVWAIFPPQALSADCSLRGSVFGRAGAVFPASKAESPGFGTGLLGAVSCGVGRHENFWTV